MRNPQVASVLVLFFHELEVTFSMARVKVISQIKYIFTLYFTMFASVVNSYLIN